MLIVCAQRPHPHHCDSRPMLEWVGNSRRGGKQRMERGGGTDSKEDFGSIIPVSLEARLPIS